MTKILKEKSAKSETTFDIEFERCVSEKVFFAIARAYGYRGRDVCTACDVLEKHGIKVIPW
jgi:hypothetical protein